MITLSSAVRRAAAATALTVGAGILLAACGSGGPTSGGASPAASGTAAPSSGTASGGGSPSSTTSPPASGSGGATPGGSHPAKATACTTAELSVTLDTGQAGGTAGSTYVPIVFQNTSNDPCTMYGFPGVSFVTGRGGSQIGAPASRQRQYSATTVRLAAGGIAHAWLQVVEAGNYSSGTCHPRTAQGLRVYPPANRAAAYVNHSFPACSSTRADILSVLPVRSGDAVQGHVP